MSERKGRGFFTCDPTVTGGRFGGWIAGDSGIALIVNDSDRKVYSGFAPRGRLVLFDERETPLNAFCFASGIWGLWRRFHNAKSDENDFLVEADCNLRMANFVERLFTEKGAKSVITEIHPVDDGEEIRVVWSLKELSRLKPSHPLIKFCRWAAQKIGPE